MNQTDANRISYNSIVKEWISHRNNTINTCIRDFCELLPENAHVLDIGCGTGNPIDKYLNQKGFSVVGIDISEKMIEEAQKLNLSNTVFMLKDFIDFTSSEKFDAVIAFDSIWHIEENMQEAVYIKVSQLLHSKGYFIFTHGKENGTIKGNMFSEEFIYSAFSANKVKELIEQNGMDIVLWQENYKEETTGTRDLLVIARKK